MKINVQMHGNFNNTMEYLKRIKNPNVRSILHRYGALGVERLQAATPVSSGLTADSWSYTINESKSEYSITWHNSNVDENGTPIVVLLHYGHISKDGAYVRGVDFINPALKDVFNDLANAAWKEVIR